MKPVLLSGSTSTSSANPQPPLNSRRLSQALEYVGYWRTMPATIDAMNTSAMKPAAMGMGAAVSARASRPSPRSLGAKCKYAAYSATTTNSAKKTALTLIPWNLGITLLNGTPKLETYHQPLVVAKHSASTKNSAARNAMRLRDQRKLSCDTSTVVSAAIAA